MKSRKTPSGSTLAATTVAAIFGFLLLVPQPLDAQEEVSSAIRRYRDREASTGYYEQHEVLPRSQQALVEIPGVRQGLFPYSPNAAQVRNRSRLADSHQGIQFYAIQRCETCHPQQARDLHTVRANITCRQCHGAEPIASLAHYYSPMNPIRKHAYVCAKCHPGANASYAGYVIHEPAAGSVQAKSDFPVLYYVYWFMFVLLVGTLAFFIPHSILLGLRELIGLQRKTKNDDEKAH
jgi:hypothetical protein